MENNGLFTALQKYIKIESFSGILLFVITIAALVWANSEYSSTYFSLLHYHIGLHFGDFEISKSLTHWVNDGLMTIFFFLIGLEIKREVLIGELNTLKKASLPIFAAVGGMFVPYLVFKFLNSDPEAASGWGIPMATDIAFTLAILQILGKRIPNSLRIFLTAFAIIDDLGAIVIIALFYGESLNFIFLSIGLGLILGLFLLAKFNLFNKYVTMLVGIVIWGLFLKSGIHPTISGVLIAFTIPIRQKINEDVFTIKLTEILENLKLANITKQPILSKEQVQILNRLSTYKEEFQSPLQGLEGKLHYWVAYLIMPIFAFVNSGIYVSDSSSLVFSHIANIGIALFIGKVLGIFSLSYLAIKLKIANLPSNVNLKQIWGIASMAGVGFTMSIFVAQLAFLNNEVLLNSSKLGVLLGSAVSAIVGSFLLLIFSKKTELVSEENSYN